MMISLLLTFLTPFLLLAAVAVGFAGANPILVNADYARVSDPAALNRWAGWCLLPLPVIAGSFAALGWHKPVFGLVGLLVLFLASLVAMIVMLSGIEKFYDK